MGANEDVLCWDVKKGELLSRWRDSEQQSSGSSQTASVTAITRSKTDPDVFAVGYSDGSIRVWDARIESVIIRFNGHRSAVTTLAFDKLGVKLASGSRDTHIIIWDLIAETGLFKLRGHKDQITGIHWIQPSKDNEEEAQDDTGLAGAFLVSTGKDALIKIWDVTAQYCLETHITQSNGECWALGVSPDEGGCITAGNDGELRVWVLDVEGLRNHGIQADPPKDPSYLHERGTITRQGKDRTISICFHPKADYVAVHGSEKSVEIWRIRSPTEVQKTMARKRKRRREKAASSKEKDADGDADMIDGDGADPVPEVSDVFILHVIVRTGGKVRSIDWAINRPSKNLQLLAATSNNQLELYDVDNSSNKKSKQEPASEPPDYHRSFAVELPGHRTDIRAIALSSDDTMLATASNGSLKIWNVQTQSCLRTLECGYALSCAFLPGDRTVVLGNNKGELELFDIASATPLDVVKAHESSIWTLRVQPDGKALASGSADKTVKFWAFETRQQEVPGTKRTIPRLALSLSRTLTLGDDILNLCFTPDSRLLAVSTLDNTVKVFFLDSLKLYLSLYGHKLPVLHMSIAEDSKLIATCSADKNIRLWGLDFGDCHRALFAHDDSVMAVAFIPDPGSGNVATQKQDSHTLFSVGKDGLLKTWDADKFVQLQKLRRHHGELSALAVSRAGDFAVTASRDRSVRVWGLSDEPLFLEEEREREMEEMHDENVAEALEKDARDADAMAEQYLQERMQVDGVEPANTAEDGTVASASKQTGGTLTASERITEALQVSAEDLSAHRSYQSDLRKYQQQKQQGVPTIPAPAPPQRHPLLTYKSQTADQYLLAALEAIPSPSLHDALLLLPFSAVPPLFEFLKLWLRRRANVPLCCRILFFVLRTQWPQVVGSGGASNGIVAEEEGAGAPMAKTVTTGKESVNGGETLQEDGAEALTGAQQGATTLRANMAEIQKCLRAVLQDWRAMTGFNAAACGLMSERLGAMEKARGVKGVDVEEQDADMMSKKGEKKRAFIGVS